MNSGLEPQPGEDSGDTNFSTAEESGDTNFSTKNQKMPTNDHLQAEDAGAGATLPDGADLELLDDENHVQSSEDGDTLEDQQVSHYAKNVEQAPHGLPLKK